MDYDKSALPIWIWTADKDGQGNDVYADFTDAFKSKSKTVLRVSCDGAFACYVNGELVAFSACSDYPDYKLYDEYDISRYCLGDNRLDFTVWYTGVDSQTYIKGDPGLWYEVVSDGARVAASSERTKSRINGNYRNGYEKWITIQLGFSFYYDNSVENKREYACSVRAKHRDILPRPQKPLYMDGRPPVSYFEINGSLIVDVGKETAGFADLDFESPCEQDVVFSYGEYLTDSGVPRLLNGRDFSFEVRARKGRNKLLFPLRRIAGRYIGVECKNKINPGYIGIRPVNYPVTPVIRRFDRADVQKIYDVCVDTLRLCMHEHYEDCPWREQALYTLDSRFQMLYGYYAFKESEYARSNLVLMAHGMREDGFMSLCFPAGRDVPIPSFSLAYVLQVCEYIQYTGDRSVLEQTGVAMERILKSFSDKIGQNGLIPIFPHPYWNFYEWTEGNDRSEQIDDTDSVERAAYCDLTLNCMFVLVAEIYNETVGANIQTQTVRQAIVDNFYDQESGLYRNSLLTTRKNQLGNALAVLIGLGNAELIEKVARCEDMVAASLSMRYFVYEALLQSGDKYKSFILDDIITRYTRMLDEGATSFWETDNGWRDWYGAGSCCHGWSALPIYYFCRLLSSTENQK